jgi:hypothetical protein
VKPPAEARAVELLLQQGACGAPCNESKFLSFVCISLRTQRRMGRKRGLRVL